MTNAKRLTFIWKRQTVSGKRGENMVTWSLLPFAVCRKRDAKSPYYFWFPLTPRHLLAFLRGDYS